MNTNTNRYYPLSLHDALPICALCGVRRCADPHLSERNLHRPRRQPCASRRPAVLPAARTIAAGPPDGIRRPLVLRDRRQRLDRLSHRSGRRWTGGGEEGAPRHAHAASLPAVAPARNQLQLRRRFQARRASRIMTRTPHRGPAALIALACIAIAALA